MRPSQRRTGAFLLQQGRGSGQRIEKEGVGTLALPVFFSAQVSARILVQDAFPVPSARIGPFGVFR